MTVQYQDDKPLLSTLTPVIEPNENQDKPSVGTLGTFPADSSLTVTHNNMDIKSEFPDFNDTQTPPSKPLIDIEFIEDLLASFEDSEELGTSHRVALEIFISRLPYNLNDRELQRIVELINLNMEGDYGYNLGKSIESLYKLRLAEDKFIESISPPSSQEEMDQINSKLAYLRLTILGEPLNELFYPASKENEDAHSGSSINSAISKPSNESANNDEEPAQWISRLEKENLSEEEIDRRITQKYGEEAASNLKAMQAIENEWLERYLKFLDEKRYITQAGISDSDKAAQTYELLSLHYKAEELDAAVAFDRMMSELQD